MKTQILALVLLILTLNVNAQIHVPKNEFNVPEVVKNAFTARYPKTGSVKWGFDKDGNYEADFRHNSREMSAIISRKGILIETLTELKESELPEKIRIFLLKRYKNYKTSNIDKVESKGLISYEMYVENEYKGYKLVFNNADNLISKTGNINN